MAQFARTLSRFDGTAPRGIQPLYAAPIIIAALECPSIYSKTRAISLQFFHNFRRYLCKIDGFTTSAPTKNRPPGVMLRRSARRRCRPKGGEPFSLQRTGRRRGRGTVSRAGSCPPPSTPARWGSETANGHLAPAATSERREGRWSVIVQCGALSLAVLIASPPHVKNSAFRIALVMAGPGFSSKCKIIFRQQPPKQPLAQNKNGSRFGCLACY